MVQEQRFSIRDLEHLSGIKAHTIRAWEQRYGLLSAKRTSTNIRFYTAQDLKNLLNIAILNKNGFKISKIAGMAESDISRNVLEINKEGNELESKINALIICMLELDEPAFEQHVNRNILQLGLEKTMLEIVFPFLTRVGLLWSTNGITPAHEHFATNIIRQKLIVAIDGQDKNIDPSRPVVLLFLPEGELHEISLLFLSYLLKNRQVGVVYLGASVPLADLDTVLAKGRVSCIHTIVTNPISTKSLKEYLDKLGVHTDPIPVSVSGMQVARIGDYNPPQNIKLLAQQNELLEWLDRVAD